MSFVFPTARVRGNGQNLQAENISIRKLNAEGITATTISTTGGGGVSADNLLLCESASQSSPAAGKGRVWVRSDTPNVLVFTDDAGTDTDLGQGGIELEEEGGAVAGGPFTTINFIGSLITAADGGGGTATVTSTATNPDLATVLTTGADASGTGITGLSTQTFDEQTTPSNPGAGKGTVFVKDTTPSTLGFVDDTGAETVLAADQDLSSVLTTGADASGTGITGLSTQTFDEQATPSNPGAGKGTVFVKNSSPSTLGFVDDSGVETVLAADQTLSSVLTTGDDATGLNLENVGELNFDTAGPKGIEIGTDAGSASAATATDIAIGASATAGGDSVVIGDGASVGAFTDCVCIGMNAVCGGNDSVAIGGNSTVAQAANAASSLAVAIGRNSAANHRAVCIGYSAASTGNYAVCLGPSASARQESIAIGRNASATSGGGAGIAIGFGATSTATNGLAFGVSASSATRALSLGDQTDATGSYSVAIGSGNAAGDGAEASTTGAIAIGRQTYSSNAFSVCIGTAVASRIADEFSHRGYRIVRSTVSTTDATQTELVTFPLSTASDIVVGEIYVTAHRTNGSDETFGATSAKFHARNKAGTVTLDPASPTITTFDTDTTTYSVALDVNGTDIRVRVTGVAANDVDWIGMVKIYCAGLT
jgi:hypothetical protein